MAVRTGWPPHMVNVWTGYHWVMSYDPADPPTLADDGPPGTEWIFSEDEALAHSVGGFAVSLFRFFFRIPLIDGSGTWFVPDGLYDGTFHMTDFRVSFIGRLYGEIWQTTHALSSSATAQVVADAVATHKMTIGAFIRDRCGIGVSWDAVKVAGYDPATGVATGDMGEAAITVPGTAAAATLPTECAVVATLRTTHPKVHGRMYFPCVVPASLTADGLLKDEVTLQLATDMVAYFHALASDAIAADAQVYSRTGHLTRNVVSVDVGNVVDAQRRRRNRLIEARTTVSL